MVENEVSVFIMNVNHPSQEDIGHELSEYLQQLQVSIAYWTGETVRLVEMDLRLTKPLSAELYQHLTGDDDE